MTFLVWPVPCGNTTVPRTFCSGFFWSTPRRTWSSIVSSNFAFALALTSSTARAVSNRRSSPNALRASRYFFPGFAMVVCSSRGACGFRPPTIRSSKLDRYISIGLADFDAHRARGAGHDLRGRVDVVGVEIRHLRLGDLAHFVHRDLADFLAVGLARTFLHAGRLLDELRCRRRLEHERERAVLEHRDDGRNDVAFVLLRALVVRFAELHDVDAVLAERRADGRRGRRGTGRTLERYLRDDFLHCLYLFNLIEFEFHRRLPAENRDERAQALFLRVDLVHRTGEIEERPRGHLHAIALGEVDLQLGRLDAHLLEDRLDLFVGKRQRFLARARRADESGDALRVAHDVPRLVGHLHLDEHVARIDLLLHLFALAVLEFDFFVGRHEHAVHEVLHRHRFDAPFEIGLDLVLVARIGVHDVPLAIRVFRGRQQFGRERGRVLIHLLLLHVFHHAVKPPVYGRRIRRCG